MMEEALINLLLADPVTAGLVGTRVYPQSRPQGSALPSVSMYSLSGGPEYADDGETGQEQRRVQFDCWGLTYSDAKLVARAVRDKLSFFFGTASGVFFAIITLDDERDLRESGTDNREYPFHVALDFTVTTGQL